MGEREKERRRKKEEELMLKISNLHSFRLRSYLSKARCDGSKRVPWMGSIGVVHLTDQSKLSYFRARQLQLRPDERSARGS